MKHETCCEGAYPLSGPNDVSIIPPRPCGNELRYRYRLGTHVTIGFRLLSFRMCDGASISAATRRGFAGRGVLQL